MKRYLILTLLLSNYLRADEEVEDPLKSVLGLDSATHDELAKSGTEHAYTVKTDRTLSILVNRLYKGDHKFLRELLSNARDALTKMRHEIVRSLGAEENVYAPDTLGELEVRVSVDEEKGMLTIKDNGVGMTAQELHDNLGKIAASGTAKAAGKVSDELVGMFGVGFYSAFMAADTVIVITKSFKKDEPQVIWRSNPKLRKEFSDVNAESNEPSYYVYKDPRGNTLERGTEIHLHLKKDAAAQKFLDWKHVKKVLESFSQFNDLRVFLLEEKEREVEVPMTEEEIAEEKAKEEAKKEEAKKAKEDKEGEDDEEEPETEKEPESEEEPEEEKKYVKKEKEHYKEWTQLDIVLPIWDRTKEEITQEDYLKFYRKLLGKKGKDKEFAKVINVRVESKENFSAILFVPKKPVNSRYSKEEEAQVAVFVRGVLVTRNAKGILPKHFGFCVGAINASRLNLNVDRESLQNEKELDPIRKKLKKKVAELLDDWMEERNEVEVESEDLEGEEGEKKKEKDMKYDEFFTQFGHYFKFGMIDDHAAKSELAKLLLFTTSSKEKQPRSLAQYKAAMPEGQTSVFYLAADNAAEALANPALQKYQDLGVEVLLLTSPLDESALGQASFESLSFVDITKESASLDFLPEEKEAAETLRKREESKEFEKLFEFLRSTDASGRIIKVRLSNKLGKDMPLFFSASDFGQSAHMQKVMRAHNLSGQQDAQAMFSGLRVLEVNPEHPAIAKLDSLVKRNKKDPAVLRLAKLLLDAAAVASGYEPGNKKDFTNYFMDNLAKELAGTEVEELVEETPAEESEPTEPEAEPVTAEEVDTEL